MTAIPNTADEFKVILNADKCLCGNWKKRRKVFCKYCYRELDQATKQGLYSGHTTESFKFYFQTAIVELKEVHRV